MDKESIDCLKTGNEAESVRATVWSVHHLKRSSPVANQDMIDILVMSNGDRNALAAKREKEQSASSVNDRNLKTVMESGV